MQADELKARIKDAVYRCFRDGRIDDYNDRGDVGRNGQPLLLQIVVRVSGVRLDPYARPELVKLIGATETVDEAGVTLMTGDGFELRLIAESTTVAAIT